MSKFKVGDRVKRTGPSIDGLVKGETYTVKEFRDQTVWVEGNAYSFVPDRFELVTKTKKVEVSIPHQTLQDVRPGDVVKSVDTGGFNMVVERTVTVPVSDDFVVPKGWRPRGNGEFNYDHRQSIAVQDPKDSTWTYYLREDEDS